jgi:hypothetical protein
MRRLFAAAAFHRWVASSSGEGTPEKPFVAAAIAQPITILVGVSFDTSLACTGKGDRLPWMQVLEHKKALWVSPPISSP